MSLEVVSPVQMLLNISVDVSFEISVLDAKRYEFSSFRADRNSPATGDQVIGRYFRRRVCRISERREPLVN